MLGGGGGGGRGGRGDLRSFEPNAAEDRRNNRNDFWAQYSFVFS
jgi:hypothetical protein